jgi:hypothetical protein
MAEQSLSPTVQELAAMPENAFLELCRDSERIDAEHAFKEADLDALNVTGQGTLAPLFARSGSPYAALGAVVSAAFAGVAVWRGMEALGAGRQRAAHSTAAEPLLQVLYPPASPGTVVTDAASPGRVTSPLTQGVVMERTPCFPASWDGPRGRVRPSHALCHAP